MVALGTPQRAPQGIFRGRRRFMEPTPSPKNPVGPSSKELNCPIVFFGPHFRFIFFKNFCYTVLILDRKKNFPNGALFYKNTALKICHSLFSSVPFSLNRLDSLGNSCLSQNPEKRKKAEKKRCLGTKSAKNLQKLESNTTIPPTCDIKKTNTLK